MKQEIKEMITILESLLEDCSSKTRFELQTTIEMLKKAKSADDLIDVQEQLEYIVNLNNIDTFISTEVYNAISIIETLI